MYEFRGRNLADSERPRIRINIRRVRDEAVNFAAQHGARKGQQQAVVKALTDAKYWLRK